MNRFAVSIPPSATAVQVLAWIADNCLTCRLRDVDSVLFLPKCYPAQLA